MSELRSFSGYDPRCAEIFVVLREVMLLTEERFANAVDHAVDVGFYAKGGDKSMVAIEHSKLPDATAATRQKHYWGDALARLKAFLEPK